MWTWSGATACRCRRRRRRSLSLCCAGCCAGCCTGCGSCFTSTFSWTSSAASSPSSIVKQLLLELSRTCAATRARRVIRRACQQRIFCMRASPASRVLGAVEEEGIAIAIALTRKVGRMMCRIRQACVWNKKKRISGRQMKAAERFPGEHNEAQGKRHDGPEAAGIRLHIMHREAMLKKASKTTAFYADSFTLCRFFDVKQKPGPLFFFVWTKPRIW